jgi:hypothetical protein
VNNSGYQNDSLRLIWEGEVFIDLTPMPRTNGWARIPFYDLIAHSDHADFAVQAYDSDSVIYLDDFDLDLAVPEPSTIFVTLAGFLLVGARGSGQAKRR